MSDPRPVHGLLGCFDDADALLAAAGAARRRGYRRLDAMSPFPVDGLAEAIGFRPSGIPWIVLAGAVVGGALGYALQWWTAVIDFPFNSGGRPLHAWPAFIVITFELTVLGGALAAFIGMLAASGLPRLYHPLFNAPSFQLASRDQFFLVIEATDPLFDLRRTDAFLREAGAVSVEEVAP